MKKIRAGEVSDVIIISAEDLKTLQAEGLAKADPVVPIASIILGVSVWKGAAKPDISTPEAFAMPCRPRLYSSLTVRRRPLPSGPVPPNWA